MDKTATTEPIKVRVDKPYVALADRGNAGSCMVAKAVREQLDLTPNIIISVNGETVEIYGPKGGHAFHFDLPKETTRRIEDWDAGIDPEEPFDVELAFPPDWRERLKAK